MLKKHTIAIVDVYVPVKRRKTLDQKKVKAIPESMRSPRRVWHRPIDGLLYQVEG